MERLPDLVAELVRLKVDVLAVTGAVTARAAQKTVSDIPITYWNSEPMCIIETIELRIVPFNEVDERFVYHYGEGDRSMGWWHKDMWDYYAVECASLGRPLTPSMPLVCERFRVVFPEKR